MSIQELLAGPLELPLVSPATEEAATDAETFELSRGRVTACFSVDTLHTGRALGSAFVRVLLATPDGVLWIGTDSDGLFRYAGALMAAKSRGDAQRLLVFVADRIPDHSELAVLSRFKRHVGFASDELFAAPAEAKAPACRK